MSLRTLMIRTKLDRKTEELEELLTQDGAFAARETELAAAIGEATTPEERETVEAAVNSFEEEHSAHVSAVNSLRDEISALQTQLDGIEAQTPPAPAQTAAEINRERMISMTPALTSIRTLPTNCRAFDTLPQAAQQQILNDPRTSEFLANVRALRGAKASVTGADLGIPVNILPVINENRFRYSKLMNRVLLRTVRGETRQPIGGLNPEAVWEDCCDALNGLSFAYSMITVTCNKVGGFVLICNALLAETDIDLLADLIEMISEAIGKAKDKAILYGKGHAYSMPAGIVPRLAQTSKPSDYPVTAPEWVDLHSTHIIKINGDSLSGAEFWAALRIAAGNTFTRYARGDQSWAMNTKTYAYLESKAIATTVTGEWVAIIGGRLPIISGDIDVLEFMPDYDIVGGYFGLYLWGQHDSAEIGTDRTGLQLRVKDATLVWGRERADGMPIIPEGFVAINIRNLDVTTAMDFPGNSANDAELQGLTVGSLVLSPSFDPDTTTYTASAANNVSSAAVTATPAQNEAVIGITVTAGATTVNVVNGEAAPLAVGENVIAITVKQGNAVKVYTVTVTRAGE